MFKKLHLQHVCIMKSMLYIKLFNVIRSSYSKLYKTTDNI